MKVPIYCLSSFNLPFIAYSAIMKLDPVCLSPCSKQHVKLCQQRGLQGYCSEGLLFLALGYIYLSFLLQWCMKGRHARVFHAVIMPSVCHPKASFQTQSWLALCTAGLAIANELPMLLFTPSTYLAALAHLYSVFSCLPVSAELPCLPALMNLYRMGGRSGYMSPAFPVTMEQH